MSSEIWNFEDTHHIDNINNINDIGNVKSKSDNSNSVMTDSEFNIDSFIYGMESNDKIPGNIIQESSLELPLNIETTFKLENFDFEKNTQFSSIFEIDDIDDINGNGKNHDRNNRNNRNNKNIKFF